MSGWLFTSLIVATMAVLYPLVYVGLRASDQAEREAKERSDAEWMANMDKWNPR